MKPYALIEDVNDTKGGVLAIYTDKAEAEAWIYYNNDHDGLLFDLEEFEADEHPEMDR